MAILSSLSFLDFKMIDQAERAAAVEKYEIKVKELEHKEEKEAKLRKKREEEELAIKNKTEAFVNHVAALPQKMYEEDVDGEIINQIPGTGGLSTAQGVLRLIMSSKSVIKRKKITGEIWLIQKFKKLWKHSRRLFWKYAFKLKRSDCREWSRENWKSKT